MKTRITLVAAALFATGLAGCVETGGDVGGDFSSMTVEQSACVRDVRNATGNSDVIVQSSRGSQAGTLVTLLVGGTGTWQCTGYSDGTTDGIQSVTDEGFL